MVVSGVSTVIWLYLYVYLVFSGSFPSCVCVCVCVCVLVAQLCPTLCYPMDCSLPGSSVRGIRQQEYWICNSFLQGIFLTQRLNPVSYTVGKFFTD